MLLYPGSALAIAKCSKHSETSITASVCSPFTQGVRSFDPKFPSHPMDTMDTMDAVHSQWQNDLLKKINELSDESHEKHVVLTRIIQELAQPKGVEAVSLLARGMEIGSGLSEEDAFAKAKEFLRPSGANFNGSKYTCPVMWRYDNESLWRGLTDNNKLIRLMRSMVLTGFLEDEPLRSRTFDLCADDGIVAAKLLFGVQKIV